MNPRDDIRDDEQIAALLKASETDAAPPDQDVLARLRGQSAEAFMATSPPIPTLRRWPRLARKGRWIGAVAAVVLVSVAAYFWLVPAAQGVTLGQLLARVEKADTLHVFLTRGGQKIELWHTSKPQRTRWDDNAGSYRITDGSNHWSINEASNQAIRTKPPALERGLVDQFLIQLGLQTEGGRVLQLGHGHRAWKAWTGDLVIYDAEIPAGDGTILLDAVVDPKTGRLWDIDAVLDAYGNRTHLAHLQVVAYDEPIDPEKFAIADTLTEDGRIGAVTDVQGIVTIKPVLHDRWTPVREHLVLRPGDWVRTDARGANATALRLVKNTGIILGPRTLVELIGPKHVRLIEGEIEITPSAGAAIELLGPGSQTIAVKGKQLYRVEKQQLARVERDPPWLLGFKGATANEALGSLVALVDGRNVPLGVGYHKVNVDIRDQIARTVIEESFVNHTGAVLEGVFYFPLPQDASISGFGMWIGDSLVEADVVEKQRAREIYETILRERRDPGLLEWSGGNIFKARVFPIPPHSEKRIKITYTQVLPLKGSRYRYSYGLQSELLQQHPLRELTIDVKVTSVVPLRSVTSPTHPTRDEKTTHSAHVEFTAQEYTPTRDFEVVVEIEGRQAEVVMIPHRRGDDGYFMLQLLPPGASGDWDRSILPNGDPLRLLILADTSASIDAGQRATQATFIGTLLASLSPQDTFNLATCDVTCDWAFGQPNNADTGNVVAARDFLAKRSSLGWTDLDVAFTSVLKQSGPQTHVIYVGDGIVTTGDADPIAFTKRLRRLVQGHGGTFHAVSLGSSFEPAVLKAIASLGSGSMRTISGEQGPTAVARELLGEIAQPALRDIKVEFTGFKVARVYPEALANAPAGSQQILLGRYLPDGSDQAGEVVVTGTQGGKPVRFSTRASFKDAEHGNSFIPRLWARMHLDSLLEQGSSEAIKDEIIALSEEFQIITPYTSLLVLESDADRERFKVKRRFQMRDGERFFADGRDNAVFDLTQKQMKQAGDWRTALRRLVLRELARLGREPRLFQPSRSWDYRDRLGVINLNTVMDAESFFALGPIDGLPASAAGWAPLGDRGVADSDALDDRLNREEVNRDSIPEADLVERKELGLEPAHALERLEAVRSRGTTPADFGGELFIDGLGLTDETMDFKSLGSEAALSLPLPDYRAGGRGGRYFRTSYASYGQWLNTLFPPLPTAPGQPQETKSTWPAAARDLAKSLLRTGQLAKITGGLEIQRHTDRFDARWGDLASRSHRLELVAAKSWLTRSESDGGQMLVSWCNAQKIGVFSQAFQLGRLRASTPLDLQPPPLKLADHSLASLERAYTDYAPTLEPEGKDRMLLLLKHESSPAYETRILIDTGRHVILSIEDRFKGKVTDTTRFDDFVEVAGTWWAQKIETTNDAGKRLSLVMQSVKTLTLNEVDQQTKTELAGRAQVQFLHLPSPSLKDAKKALAAGKAGFDDQFVLLLHFLRSEQWPRVFDHLAQAEAVAPGRPGLRWLRSALLEDARRHEELRQRNQEDALRLAKGSSADAYFLAQYIVGQSRNILQANETLSLLDTLKPLYDKQPVRVQARKSWQQMRAYQVCQTGRSDEALRLQKQLAADYPRDYALQQEYAQTLASSGDYAAAYAWLTRVLVKESKWLDHEEDSLRATYASFLQQQGRTADLVNYLAAWLEQRPASHSACAQYLSALLKSDQIEKADAFALRWLKDAQVPGELSAAAQARLQAAVEFMLGNIQGIWMNRIEERWRTPLAGAALYFARHEERASVAEQILQPHYQFLNSEEGRKLRKELAKILTSEIDTLPAEQVRRFLGWVPTEDMQPAEWTNIAVVIGKRWISETKDDVKHVLGHALLAVLSRQETPGNLLAFLRLQLQTGPARHRADYANQLFDQLLAQPWSAEFEAEAFTLLDKLSTADDVGSRLFRSVAALHRLTDRLLESRIAAQTKLLEHPEKLTRTELLKKQDAIRRLAHEGVADRLRKEASRHPKALAPWLVVESLYLDVNLDRNRKQAAAEAWAFLGAAPPAKVAQDSTIERALDDILRQRYLVTATNLAARNGADPGLVERLLKYVDQGITADADGMSWKMAKYRLLIALDRPRELERALRQWVSQDDADSRWRTALGYLLAEQGKLPDAIREFEAVESADELSPGAYRALAGWYLVRNQREGHERAAAAVYRTTPEHYLSQMIAAKLYPWQRGEGRMPSELDKEVLRMFAVLFDKSVAPQRYLHQLQQFYQASHDFRLLAGLPDAVGGHTAARVYPFLQGMQSVLDEVRDEAIADEIVKRIADVRPRAKTAVDRRALDLLEALVERRAAEVQNQPGPHRDRALAALQRAFKHDWSPGEPRLMADFLASLGNITQPALADEQLRQLKGLHGDAAAGSLDRLHIAHRYAATVHNHNAAAAVDLLQAALDEYQAANEGVLPVVANDALASFVGYLEGAGHFARGEKVLLAQLSHPAHEQQRRWLVLRLDELYHRTLAKDGDVSLGKGLTLYQALNAKIQKDAAEPDPLKRYQLGDLLCQVYRTAHEKKLPGVAANLKTFAFEIAPPLVKDLTNYHPSIAGVIAQTVHDLIGPRDGIAYLVNEIEGEPRWLRYNNQDGWTRHGGTLAQWRWEAKDLGDVEARLLKLTLAELRRDLETREARNRTIYHLGHERFWNEKTADFARTAERVLAERGKSGAAVQYIADYFYAGLGKADRAIEILFVARNQKLLDETGETMLVRFLQREGRYAESIAVLLPLLDRRPANLDYRVDLMRAYFRTGRTTELLALLKQTDTFFHEKDRWGENPLDRLAHSTLQNELYEQSVAYFKELIPLHERTRPNRGIGDGTLSGYYAGLANAYAGLKKTPEAVEAAEGAIVAWGSDRDNRARALDSLKQVLLRSPDLDGFVAHFDQQRQDSAIVRKALGQAYRDKKEPAKAIKQLQQAAQLQPNDAEVHQLLVAAYDDIGDKQGAARQLLQAVQASRRDLKLYQNLGYRYAAAGQNAQAERAFTSIVEMLPSEAESHALLAEVREKQDRWREAIRHWEQVARLRALEPTGLLKLAAAQIHEKQWDAARDTLGKLNCRTWPARFGDVPGQVRTLTEAMPQQSKQ